MSDKTLKYFDSTAIQKLIKTAYKLQWENDTGIYEHQS